MAFGTISTFQPLHTRCAPGKTGTLFGTFDFVHVTEKKSGATNVSRTNRSTTTVSLLLRLFINILSFSNISIYLLLYSSIIEQVLITWLTNIPFACYLKKKSQRN